MSENKNYKELAIHFLTLTASGKIDEAYSKYVSMDFKHHNPYFKGDRASLMTAMKENVVKMPNKVFEVKMAFQEGDKVATYSRVKMDKMEIAVMHIIKFKGEKIIEMWDLGQPISKDSPNENGMF